MMKLSCIQVPPGGEIYEGEVFRKDTPSHPSQMSSLDFIVHTTSASVCIVVMRVPRLRCGCGDASCSIFSLCVCKWI